MRVNTPATRSRTCSIGFWKMGARMMVELPEDVAAGIILFGVLLLGMVLIVGVVDVVFWLYESVHPAAAYGVAACVGVVLAAFGLWTFPVEGDDV